MLGQTCKYCIEGTAPHMIPLNEGNQYSSSDHDASLQENTTTWYNIWATKSSPT